MATLRRLDDQGLLQHGSQQATIRGFEHFLKDQAHLTACAGSEGRAQALQRERVDRDGRLRPSAEQMAAVALGQRERTKAAVAADMRARLARVLADRHRDAVCGGARRELTAGACPELRDLQRRCLDEQVSQQRAVQELERQVNDEADRQREQQALEEAELAQRITSENEQANSAVRRDHREAVGRVQFSQVAAKRTEREQMEANERMRDRARADGLAAKAAEEDAEVVARRRSAQAEARAALDRLVACRDADRAAEARRSAAAERDAESFNRGRAQIEAHLAEERRRAEAARDEVFLQIASAIEDRDRETREFYVLREALEREEALVRERRAEAAELERRMAARSAAAEACRDALMSSERKREADCSNEDRWREEFKEHLERKDRVDQLGAQRRRQLAAAHHRETERFVAERRQHLERQREAEQREAARLQADEEHRLAIIEAERLRLLREHGFAAPLREALAGVA